MATSFAGYGEGGAMAGPLALFVSFDGLRPDALQRPETPSFNRLLPESAYTLSAVVDYPWTLPSHALPHLIPPEVRTVIAQALWPEPISPKKCFNLLLGVPTKHLVARKPEFSYRYNELVHQRVPGFAAMEHSLAAEVRAVLRQGVGQWP